MGRNKLRLSLSASDFNLEHTLECGQAFRWEKSDNGYQGVIGRALLKINYDGARLQVESSSPLSKEALTEYFGLNENMPRILKEIDLDSHIHKAILKFHGLRVLNQDHWECLASYILSSYNNIARIKIMIEKLSRAFGERLTLGCIERRSFPSIEKIAAVNLSALKKLGLGFRASYLKKTAGDLLAKRLDLDSLENLSYNEAKTKLTRLKGVGEKVADCVLLFSFKKYEAFPVDVWIKRAVERFYFNGRPVSSKRAAEFAREYFGRYAGYAQEYLYHYMRCGYRQAGP
ncbi:MAG: DNA glycosylase [Candidatus Omnitrophota bacterium]